jgi:hypothetical protein
MLFVVKSDDNEHGLETLAEMASRLRLHPQELRREVEEGGLPAVKVGLKGLLFDPRVVLRILQQRAQQAAGTAGEG